MEEKAALKALKRIGELYRRLIAKGMPKRDVLDAYFEGLVQHRAGEQVDYGHVFHILGIDEISMILDQHATSWYVENFPGTVEQGDIYAKVPTHKSRVNLPPRRKDDKFIAYEGDGPADAILSTMIFEMK